MIEHLNFGYRSKLVPVLQTEAAECGLACIAMIASYYGYQVDLPYMRQRFPLSLKGASLKQLVDVCGRLKFSTRAVRADLDEIGSLRLPCVIHWTLNHYVVLKEYRKGTAVIVDPAFGERRVTAAQLSDGFTGVALEVWPNSDFGTKAADPPLRIRELIGDLVGFKGAMTQILTLALCLEVLALISPLFTQWVLDNVITSHDTSLLNTLAVGFVVFMLIQQATSAFHSWALMYISTSTSVQWRSNVFSHLIRLPLQYFEKRHLGDIVSRMGTVETILQTLTSSFLGAVIDGVVTIVTLAMMLIYSPPLAAISIAAMMLYGIGRIVWHNPLRVAMRDSISKSASTQSHFLETMRGIKAIQLYQKREIRRASWLSLLVQQVNAGLRTQKLQLAYQQLNGLLFGLEGIAVIWLGAKSVMGGGLTVGMLMAFNAYRSRFNTRVGALIDNYFSVKMLQVQGERLADIVLTAAEDNIIPSDDELRQLDGSLQVRDLSFRYAHGEPTIIRHMSFTIASGSSVAIVGRTGSGKSTLVNLILGNLRPTGGEVLACGKDINLSGSGAVRAVTATVMQDDSLFAGSLRDNISFWDEAVDVERLERCATLAGIREEIDSFPMGFETLVGDMGTVLSAGQRQRVLLARALYKDPKILMLDEATSNLDVNTENRVNAALRLLPITRIVVAHRLSTIASVDRVLYIEEGMLALDTTSSDFLSRGIYVDSDALSWSERTKSA